MVGPTTLNIEYCRRDTKTSVVLWSERKTFATILDEFKYENCLRKHFNYALRHHFNTREISVNVEFKED